MKYLIHYHGQIVRDSLGYPKTLDGFTERKAKPTETFSSLEEIPEIYRTEFADMVEHGQVIRGNGLEMLCIKGEL